ncbi:hypothetical protein BGX27_007271, partial [Mortierella sp. AM989]
NTKERHPAYLMPAIQNLKLLVEQYPDLTAEMFSNTSYIKVKNKAFIAANATIVNIDYRLQFWKAKSTSLNDYKKPVMYLRSQLPFQPNSLAGFLSDRLSNRSNRIKSFPKKRNNTLSVKRPTGKIPAIDEYMEERSERHTKDDEYMHEIY